MIPKKTALLPRTCILPTWAASAVSTLAAADLQLDCADYDRSLTRREAACLLYQAHLLREA